MTDRTGGKSFNYKLLSTTGAKEVVNREPRPRRRCEESSSLPEDQDQSVRRKPTEVIAEFVASLSQSIDSSSQQVESVASAAGTSSQESASSDPSPHQDISLSYSTTLVHESSGDSESDHSELERNSLVSEEPEISIAGMDLEQSKINEASVAEDIDDFMEENPLDDIASSIPDLDDAIRGIESLRSAYRNKHKEVVNGVGENNYDNESKEAFQRRVDEIKKYILYAKDLRKKLREGEGRSREAEETKVDVS